MKTQTIAFQTAVSFEGYGAVYQVLPVSDLELAPYATMLKVRRSQKAIKDYNDDKFAPISVSARDGKFFIVDGVKRYDMLLRENKKTVLCRIYEGLDYQHEAAMYARQHDDQADFRPCDKYMVLLEAHDEVAMRLKSICDMMKVEVFDGSSSMQLKAKQMRYEKKANPVLFAISCAMRILTVGTDFDLINVFNAIERAGWRYRRNGYSQTIITSLNAVFKTHATRIPLVLEVIGEKTKRYSPERFVSMCQSHYAPEKGYGPIGSMTRYLLDAIEERMADEEAMEKGA